jgi:dTDP-4-amino-4,6-dideoxygalactose transaminase
LEEEMAKLAALGGKSVREEKYPDWPVYDERDIEAVTEVIRSGQWGGYPWPGPKTAEFAKKFAEMQGVNYAVPMMNGTVTMEVALRAADIGWGDEVIVPAYTFMATAVAPMAAGAIPVLVDIDQNNYCMDPAKFEAAITSHTKAVIVVHLGAQMTDMDSIMAIAKKHNLVVIEDCAHAHGAKWRGMGAGSIGDFGSFSMQSSKIITTGEGGVLTCRDAEMAERAASIIDCGRAKDAEEKHNTMGVNYRLPEIQAALGLVALERFPEQIRQRAEHADYLEESLSEVPGVRLLRKDPRHTVRSFYRYVIAIDPEVFGAEHQAVCYALEHEGVSCWDGYPAMHRNEIFQPRSSKLAVPSAFPEKFDYSRLSLPETERATELEAVWLDENIFRAGRKGVEDAVKAIQKLTENRKEMELIEEERKKMLRIK